MLILELSAAGMGEGWSRAVELSEECSQFLEAPDPLQGEVVRGPEDFAHNVGLVARHRTEVEQKDVWELLTAAPCPNVRVEDRVDVRRVYGRVEDVRPGPGTDVHERPALKDDVLITSNRFTSARSLQGHSDARWLLMSRGGFVAVEGYSGDLPEEDLNTQKACLQVVHGDSTAELAIDNTAAAVALERPEGLLPEVGVWN